MAHSPHKGQSFQEPHSTRTNLERTTRSPSNSQATSLNGSQSSQLSQGRRNAAGDLDLIRDHGAMTPSTPLSNESSQEGTDRPYLVESDVSPVEQDGKDDRPIACDALNQDHTSAPKRMVNGEVKPSEFSLPTSPVDSSQYGHSRNSSRTSRGSQIGELSSQLQTRLSYAMVKVQNGWQSHSISELESMASVQASPISAVSDVSRLYERHLPTKSPADQSRPMQLSEPTAAAPKYAYPSSRNSATISGYLSGDLQQDDLDQSSRQVNVGAAYESFWRDHEASDTPRHTEASIVGPSLAPPADIVARAPHRSEVTKKQPRSLRTNNLYTNLAPITPPPKRQSKIRTPSQQAEVEKDAVETLLFMSSPGAGGSGCHPPGAFARAPLQNQHAHQPDNLGLSRPDEATGGGEQHGPYNSSHLPNSAEKKPLSDAEMDKILDEMPDTSSSDDDELSYHRPRPQILGT